MKVVWKLVFLSKVSKKKRSLRKQWVSTSKKIDSMRLGGGVLLTPVGPRETKIPSSGFLSRNGTYVRHFPFQFTMKSIPNFRRPSFTLSVSLFRLGLTNLRSISRIFTHIYQPLSQINWKKCQFLSFSSAWIFQAYVSTMVFGCIYSYFTEKSIWFVRFKNVETFWCISEHQKIRTRVFL